MQLPVQQKLKKKSCKNKPIKEWMTPNLVLSIRNRDKLAKQVLKYPNNERLKQYYKRVKNNITNSIRNAKDNYYRSEIEDNKADPRKLWSAIHKIHNSKQKVSSNIKKITIENQLIECDTQKEYVASKINEYFCNTGEKLASEISTSLMRAHNTNINQSPNLVQPTSNILLQKFERFSQTNEIEVVKTIMNLKNRSAPGEDSIYSSVMKKMANSIASPLSHIFNLSFEKGIFPNIFKTAVITPIYKNKGKKTDLLNYRPIAVLSNISKVLEKLVQTRLEKFLDEKELISPCQFGFRKKLGTEDALINLTSFIHKNIDINKKVIAVFLDIKKAYESISHEILLIELKKIGIDSHAFDWFKSYLTDRCQRLKLTDHISQPLLCKAFSIPTGSILGPALFNIYINNLPKVSKGHVVCYADDASICYVGDNWTQTFKMASDDLKNINIWYSQMYLQLNLNKSNYVAFSLNSVGQPPENQFLTIPDITNQPIPLQRKTHVRYLGVFIDQHLKWTHHVQLINTKLRYLMYLFYNFRRVCSIKIIRMIYHALAQSLLQYGICTWGGAYNNVLDPLRRTQNILLRIILQKDRLFHSNTLYELLDVLKLQDIYLYKLTIYSIKYENLWELNLNPYHTRQYGQTQTIRTNKSLTKRHFIYRGQVLLNKIPPDIKLCKDFPLLLKSKTKEWIKHANISL